MPEAAIAKRCGRRKWVASLKNAALLLGAVASTWLVCVFLGPYVGPFIIFIFFAIPFFLLRKKRYVVCLLWFLLCPLSVYFAWGVVSYWQGTAVIVFHGLPGTASLNVDPVLRCERATCGCVIRGYEWVWKVPNNSAVRLMTLLFGPMPGAYTGPYPTEEEAFEALQNAIPISPKYLMSDLFIVQGRKVQLDRGVGNGILAHMLISAVVDDEQ
jgi:hypothetical protein